MQIQEEYRNLLVLILPLLKTRPSLEVLDEINLFWIKNISLVRLYLSNEFAGKDSYLFTASTFLDVTEKEHYAFLLLGKHHVLDDPLCKYSDLCIKAQELFIAEEIMEQIVKTAEDNIKIIENCKNEILIFPVRLASQFPNDASVFKIGERLFTELFVDINSIHEYFEKCDSYSDILQYARDDIGEIVLFSEYDDKNISFEKRFKQAKKNTKSVYDYKDTDANAFFMMVFGQIQQAAEVIISCSEYKCNPFIRCQIALNYISLVKNGIGDIPAIPDMRFKMCVANLVYRICDKERLGQFGYDKFLVTIETSQFNESLFTLLAEKNIAESTFSLDSVVPVIEKCLDELYSSIQI